MLNPIVDHGVESGDKENRHAEIGSYTSTNKTLLEYMERHNVRARSATLRTALDVCRGLINVLLNLDRSKKN